jgi:hypothetical protein
MNTNVKYISGTVYDIKGKLTDYQYKTVMDILMVLNNEKEVVKEELEEVVDEELEELSRQISFLNIYVATMNDIKLNNVLFDV